MQKRVTLTAIEGITVGHRTRSDRPTGCTVIVCQDGATAGVAVRGSAPGTRETDLLAPTATVEQIHAVLLSGGSAFGLAAADGVVAALRHRAIGFETPGGPVPLVPAAVLFDLGVGGDSAPDAEDGRAAVEAASDAPVTEGCVGAGAGATVGKMLGIDRAMKGGIGTAGFRFVDGTIVAALIAVNCRGDVVDRRRGRLVAGTRDRTGRGLLDVEAALLGGDGDARFDAGDRPLTNTTIGVVATNRRFDKAGCTRLAGVAHDGVARAIIPAHTRMDGDTLFFVSTGRVDEPADAGEHDRIETAAAAATELAVVSAVTAATGLPGFPSAAELGTV